MAFSFGAHVSDRALNADLGNLGQGGGLSPISYVLEGEIGTRIFKMQYSNIGFREDIEANNISTDFANFQLWLYESTNIIEVHFGESLITDNSLDFQGNPGPFVALIPEFQI
ncbi:MAG: hypothetical protein Q4G27_07255 [Flavobacteriaceae bacterium]|nr:hypothetical protein [Flavobacteriaceae bacterium]